MRLERTPKEFGWVGRRLQSGPGLPFRTNAPHSNSHTAGSLRWPLAEIAPGVREVPNGVTYRSENGFYGMHYGMDGI